MDSFVASLPPSRFYSSDSIVQAQALRGGGREGGRREEKRREEKKEERTAATEITEIPRRTRRK
jgi:hypothetical protein